MAFAELNNKDRAEEADRITQSKWQAQFTAAAISFMIPIPEPKPDKARL